MMIRAELSVSAIEKLSRNAFKDCMPVLGQSSINRRYRGILYHVLNDQSLGQMLESASVASQTVYRQRYKLSW